MYAKYAYLVEKTPKKSGNSNRSNKVLKPYHHITLDREFKFYCKVWEKFLDAKDHSNFCRPMLDLSANNSVVIGFFSDASAAKDLGFGCFFGKYWLYGTWEPSYISNFKPSIEYLELFAMVASIITWSYDLRNARVTVWCDNKSVVHMVNQISSSCPNCMYLICMLTLDNLRFNRRVFAQHLTSQQNFLADALSRGRIAKFKKLAPPGTSPSPDKISEKVWPASKLWNAYLDPTGLL